MPVAQSDRFSPAQQRLAELAGAMAHPARIAILEVLARRDACICGTIVDELPLAQATVSQHLKKLKTAGLITGTIDGPRSCYCINTDVLLQAREQLMAWFGETAQACCSTPIQGDSK